MKFHGNLGTVLLAGTLMIVMQGCEKQGPLEKAGKAVDDSVEEAGDVIEEATDRR